MADVNRDVESPHTCIQNSTQFEYRVDLFDYLNIFLSITIILMNFFVVLSIGLLIHRGQQPRATYVYLGNISLSDMIIGIVNLFIIMYPHQFYNEFLCSLSMSVIVTASMASAFTVGLIAIDRYLYILYGLYYHRYITTQHSPSCVSFIWLVSMLFGFVSIFFWRNPMQEHACWLIFVVPPQIALILISAGAFPLVLIFVLYSIILKNALNSMSRINCATVSNSMIHARDIRMYRAQVQGMSNCENDALPSGKIRSFCLPCCRSSTFEITPTMVFENKWKAVKIVAFTTGAFTITWFPSFITLIFFAYCDCDLKIHSEYCENLEFIYNNPMSSLCLSNSLLNPIIYAWWHQGFRDAVKKMYYKLLGKKLDVPSQSPCPKLNIHNNCSFKQIGHEK